MAGSMSLFGVNEIAMRLPSIFYSTMVILLTYRIGEYFFDRRSGFLAALFIAMNGLLIELVAGRVPTDHIDIAFLFYIELAIFLSILFVRTRNPWYNILTGLSIGIAILTKWLPALIVLPVCLLLVMDSGKFRHVSVFFNFLVLLAVTTLVFLPWQIYIFREFPLEASWESHYNFLHLSQAVEDRGGPFYYFIDRIRINYHDLLYLPMIWFIVHYVHDQRNLKLLALIIWVFVPLFFFSSVATKMQAYTLFISPALFIITAAFFYWLYDYRKQHKYKWLTGLVLILLIALPVRYSIERVKPFNITERNPQWVRDLRLLDEQDIQKGVLFNYNKPIEAMFYTDLVVYPIIPSIEKIEELQNIGQTIIINDKGNIPQDILLLDNIKFISLTED
jgi:4-amino-4-deoxy-L-arabinose transferase